MDTSVAVMTIEVAIKIPSSHVENLIFLISSVVNTIQIHQIEAKNILYKMENKVQRVYLANL